jgi:hypothetical protein
LLAFQQFRFGFLSIGEVVDNFDAGYDHARLIADSRNIYHHRKPAAVFSEVPRLE